MRAFVVIAIVALPAIARADWMNRESDSLIATVGGHIGYGAHPSADNGVVVGAEVSVARVWWNADDDIESPNWGGGYIDLVRDTGADRTRVSFGPEIGVGFFGIDGGVVHEIDGAKRWGWAARPVITAGVATLGIRYVRFSENPDPWIVEVSLLVKLPKRIR
jgi:hypothetical protein